MSIKFGIIGHGFMGHVHEEMLTNFEETEVIGVTDIIAERLEDTKDGILRYNSTEELLANPDIDVVIVAANNNQHKDIVIKAAKSGKHVICEKPVAMSLTDLEDMSRICEECGTNFTVHQQRRFDSDFRTAKAVFDSKSLGEVYTIQSRLYGYNGNMHDWHVLISEGGGMLYDWGVHLIDQILWMIPGKLLTVYADIRNIINQEVDDYFKIILRFENNITAEIELGTYFLSDKEGWFEHHWIMGGNKGTMYIDGFKPNGKIVRTTDLLTNVVSKPTMTSSGPTRSFGPPREGLIVTEDLPIVHTTHIEFFHNYVKAFKGEEEFIVKIPEVARVLRVMEAVRESGRTGKSIDFE